MKSPVCPELPTASVGSSQAPTAAVDNSAPSAIRPESTYKSGKVVQTSGATSHASGILPRDPAHKLNVFVKDTLGLRGEPGGRVHIDSDFIDHLTSRLVSFFDELDEQVQQFMARAQQGTQADGPATGGPAT